MRGPRNYRTVLVLAAAMTASMLTSGCVARVRVDDENHRGYHYWDEREEHAYRHYLGERQEDYREHSQMTRDQERDYWQ